MLAVYLLAFVYRDIDLSIVESWICWHRVNSQKPSFTNLIVCQYSFRVRFAAAGGAARVLRSLVVPSCVFEFAGIDLVESIVVGSSFLIRLSRVVLKLSKLERRIKIHVAFPY